MIGRLSIKEQRRLLGMATSSTSLEEVVRRTGQIALQLGISFTPNLGSRARQSVASSPEGEGKMTDSEQPADGIDSHVNFDAPAVLRKWPSLNNARSHVASAPYLVVDGTLDQCVREFIAKPAATWHLYEIHTSPQPPLVSAVLSGELLAELARLRDFL